MILTKPWYLSRTIWASVVTILISIGGILGFPVDGLDSGALTDTLLQAITALAGLFAILGRVSAKATIK
jgi:hypothetical protein